MTVGYPKGHRFWWASNLAILVLGGIIPSCLDSNVCGKEMVESNGLCVLPPDTEKEPDSGFDSDTGGPDAGESELPGGMEDPCTSNGDCLEEADYCLLVDWPDDPVNGICTLQNCDLEADDCPEGWECLDLAALAPIPIELPTACSPISTAKRTTVDGTGGVR